MVGRDPKHVTNTRHQTMTDTDADTTETETNWHTITPGTSTDASLADATGDGVAVLRETAEAPSAGVDAVIRGTVEEQDAVAWAVAQERSPTPTMHYFGLSTDVNIPLLQFNTDNVATVLLKDGHDAPWLSEIDAPDVFVAVGAEPDAVPEVDADTYISVSDNTRMVKAEVGEFVHRQLRQKRAEMDSTLQAATEAALREWYRGAGDEETQFGGESGGDGP